MGSAESASLWPSQGSSSLALSSAVSGFTWVMPLLLGEEQRDERHLLLDVGGVDRIELDGDLARDVVDPGFARIG